jgi:hypothetical protein
MAVSLLQRLTFPDAGMPAQRKVSKRLCPWRTALRLGSVFPPYGVHPGASPTVCFAAPPLDVCGYAARRCAPNPRMNTSARPADGAKNQKPKPKQDHKPNQKPLTLTLSQRERGLIEMFGRATPTCDTALNSGSKKQTNQPLTLTLSQRERGLIEVFGRATPTCDTALNSGSEKQTNQPLAMRKRGLIEVIGRATPTCDTALNSGSEKQTNQPLTLQEKQRTD